MLMATLGERLGHPSGIDAKEHRCRAPAALALHVEQGRVAAKHRTGEGVSELFGGAVADPSGHEHPTPSAV